MPEEFSMWEEEYQKRINTIGNLGDMKGKVEEGYRILQKTLRAGKKILIFGNGGSSAEAQHFATELMCRYRKKRVAFPAVALGADSTFLTAVANDMDFTFIFSRGVEALGQEGDVAIALTTSGMSSNVVEGVKMAKQKGLKVIALLGNSESPVEPYADLSIHIPSDDTAVIQEMHLFILHFWAKSLEGP
ncbi:MAG: D-sedoheptulose-7-phosphate isomerase [bacterium JZ-2024 1]